MNWKKIRFIFPLVIVLVSVYIIVASPELLTSTTFKNDKIPLGTLISWLGLFCYALFFNFLLPAGIHSGLLKILKTILLVNVFVAAFWGVISTLLAGNWAFSFHNNPFSFKIWIGVTILVIVLPVMSWLGYLLFKIFKK